MTAQVAKARMQVSSTAALPKSLAFFDSGWRSSEMRSTTASRAELISSTINTSSSTPISTSFSNAEMRSSKAISVLLLVLIVELINSALEAVVDRISLELHPLSKNAKDFGSAAVLLTCILAFATWAVVLFNRFY